MEDTQITVADLVTLKNVMDLACTRGAFRAPEMEQVGKIYNKLTTFLEQALAQVNENPALNQSQGE
jgi:hypothetical protein